jgi:hypothetical protein
MGFNQGHGKSGGRKPGTPNKRTLTLIEVLEQHGYSPIADLIEYSQLAKTEYDKLDKPPAIDDSMDGGDKLKLLMAHAGAAARKPEWIKIGVQCATGILPYVYPKRKPQDNASEINPETIGSYSTAELLERAKALISEHDE